MGASLRSDIMATIAILVLACIAAVSAKTYFKEEFGAGWEDRWVVSDWKKSEGQAGTWDVTAGDWYGDAEADKGLHTSEDARFYAISAKHEDFSNKDKPLVIQFSVKHAQKIDCSGGYMKLFPAGTNQEKLHGGADEDKYNIMFGPDICGTGTKKVHVIFNYKGQNLLTKKDIKCETDELTHLYTLIVKPDNTYIVNIDQKEVASGSLFDDWEFLKPKTIKDPAISKPKDWVDEKKIDDPEEKKPDGWDDIPKQVSDPEASKPEDWDDEDDGEWEPPMIDNPEYKGEWKAKKIDNPDYKGEWEHPMIDNPDFVDDPLVYSYESFAVAAFEIWQVKAGSIFDNVIITDRIEEADALAKSTFLANKDGEKKMYDKIQEEKRAKEEEERKKAEEASAADEDEEDEDDDDDEEKTKDEL